MKEIMMTIHTSAEGDSTVTVSAKFEDHASAVRFHEGLAALVKAHSYGGAKVISTTSLGARLIGMGR